MNKLILLALAATALASDCAIDYNTPDQEYYLRFLPETDSSYDEGFTKDVLQNNAKYMGYLESDANRVYLKIGAESKFTVEKFENGFRVFSTDSKLSTDKAEQKRMFSWNQSLSTNNGYYMYPSSESKGYLQTAKFTQLFYDNTNVLSAAQTNPTNPTKLAIYNTGDGNTAIYKFDSDGVTQAKFCFQKVAPQPTNQKCTVGGTLLSKVKTNNAKLEEPKCGKDETIVSKDTCKEICLIEGTPGVHTCENGEWKETTTSACISSKQKTDFDTVKENLNEELTKLSSEEVKATTEWIVANLQSLKTLSKQDLKVEFNKFIEEYKIEEILKILLAKLSAEDKKKAEDWIKQHISTLKDLSPEELTKKFNEYLANQRKTEITAFLDKSQTDYGKKYNAEIADVQVEIRDYVYLVLESENEITQENVNKAVEKYYNDKIKEFLYKSQTDYGKKYQAENADVQVKIQEAVDTALATNDITQETVEQALEDYYKPREEQIQNFLKESTTADGKKYKNEDGKEKSKIQNFIEKELAGKDITQEEVDAALTKYYKKNGAVQFGVFGALVCLLLLH